MLTKGAEGSLGADHAGEDPTLSTASEELVRRLQSGDESAFSRLWSRYLPRLKRWARGRLPHASRNDADSDDLVQDTFIRCAARLRTLEPRGPNSVFAYIRTAMLNQIRDRARLASRRPSRVVLESDEHHDPNASPLEELLGREAVERYEGALATLSESDQDLVTAFVELRCTDSELAELLGRTHSLNAVRVARRRAIARLARAMVALRKTG